MTPHSPTTGGPGDLRSLSIMAGVCFVVGFAVYGNALGGDFVWDDRFLILDSIYTKSFDHLGRVFSTSFWDLGEAHDRFRSFYRPIVIASYVLDFRLWGPNPVGFHGTNLFLHIAVSLLGFELVRNVCGRVDLAGIATAVFLVHPIHTESVTWISGRTDLLCAFFYLASLLAYLYGYWGESGRGARVLSVGCFVAAVASKEMAVTLPAILVLLELLAERGALDRASLAAVAARCRSRLLPFVVALLAVLAWRNQVLGSLTVRGFELGPLALLGTIVHVTARYITLLVAPLRQDIHWSDPPVLGLGDERLPADLAIVAVTAVVLTLAARRDRTVRFGAAWLALTLVPAFNIGSFGDVILAERFLYIPSLGFSVLVAAAILRAARALPRARLVAAVLVAASCIPLAVLTVRRNEVWSTEVKLFETAARTSPSSGYILSNLGFAYAAEERYAEAAATMERAVALAPLSALSWSNYGVIFERLGAMPSALRAHRRALELDPDDPRAHFNLANTLKALGRDREAERSYRRAIELKPEYGEAYTNLGLLHFERGELDAAEQAYRRAISIDPTLSKAHNNLGGLDMARQRWGEAVRDFQRALEHDPSNARAARNLGEALEALGQIPDAIKAFRLARALDPDLLPASIGLARNLARSGDRAAAEQVLTEVLRRHPRAEEARELLRALAGARAET